MSYQSIGEEDRLEVWNYLEAKLREEGLGRQLSQQSGARARSNPIALVYPEGVWYKLVGKMR